MNLDPGTILFVFMLLILTAFYSGVPTAAIVGALFAGWVVNVTIPLVAKARKRRQDQ